MAEHIGLKSEAKGDVPKACILSNDQQGAASVVAKKKSDCIKIFFHLIHYLSKSSWSLSLLLSLLQYSMMFFP